MIGFVGGAQVVGGRNVRSSATCSRSMRRSVMAMATKGVEFASLDGAEIRVGLVSTKWSKEKVSALVADCKRGLSECNVKEENIVEVEVPGSFELPIAARYIALTQKVDAVIAVGVLINGETDHYHYISNSVSTGLMSLQLQTGIPMIFGVLTCKTEAQAEARSTGSESHAVEWGKTAVEMGLFRKSQIGSPKEKRVGFT